MASLTEKTAELCSCFVPFCLLTFAQLYNIIMLYLAVFCSSSPGALTAPSVVSERNGIET